MVRAQLDPPRFQCLVVEDPGGLAQLGEHLLCKQGVVGSIPSSSTKIAWWQQACGFRIYFTPLPGFFSPFPHGTGSLSVDDEYLALEDGPPIFRQGFSCPALLFSSSVPPVGFHIQGYHLLWPDFPFRFVNRLTITRRLFRFRSPLLSESRLMSFPLGT